MEITKAQIDKIFPKDGQKACEFVLGAHNASQFPQTFHKEFAFIGASNVGKSSLVNALTAQKIAIVSNTPGRTRQVNFFLQSEKLMIVDMPGYGFAKAKDKHIAQWQKTSFEYFAKRAQLKRVFLLIDPIKGIKESDLDIINVFNSLGVSFQIILTKCDKIKPHEAENVKSDIIKKSQKWPAFFPEIIFCSTKYNQGIFEIKSEIVRLYSL
jgi:GTP-binding protein